MQGGSGDDEGAHGGDGAHASGRVGHHRTICPYHPLVWV